MGFNSSRENICQSFQERVENRRFTLRDTRAKTMNRWQRRGFTRSRLPHFPINFRDILKLTHTSTLALTVSSIIVKETSQSSLPPDVYVVLGADKNPQRRSFYTWSEGAVPTAVFEFLSDATANQDRHEKARLYMVDIGVQEYFIHQPDMERRPEFRGWRRNPSGGMQEIAPDERGGLFSEALNLWFRWQEQLTTQVRLLRPYLPDDTPITTSKEEHRLRVEAQALAAEEAAARGGSRIGTPPCSTR